MKKVGFGVLIAIVALGLFALRTVWRSGSFKTITNNFSGSVQKMEGIVGGEDIAIDQQTGVAYVSSDDRWASALYRQPVKGAIFSLNLNDSLPQPKNLTTDFAQPDFHPHGISFYTAEDGTKWLFVVNHRENVQAIEIFEINGDTLNHLQSISHEAIISPNDVVAIGKREFYFTNDHNEPPSGWRAFKDILTIGTGNVCFFDGTSVEVFDDGLKYANGINKSPDGKRIYVAVPSDLKILIYDRDLSTGALTKSDEIVTGTGVDNIDVDEEGNLWVGCHPQLLKFLSHAKEEAALSPSEIIKLTNLGNGKFEQQTIYMNDGSEISGSSVGAVYKDKLLIGPVFERHILVAELP
jgi:arylesterase / paraoxonase